MTYKNLLAKLKTKHGGSSIRCKQYINATTSYIQVHYNRKYISTYENIKLDL